MEGVLAALGAGGDDLDDFDRAFGVFLERINGKACGELAVAAALASRRAREGDVCVELHRVLGAEICPRWIAALRDCSVVGPPDPDRRLPLVLDDRGRLYLQRLWYEEYRLAQGLRALAATEPQWCPLDVDRCRTVIDRLFPMSAEGGEAPDWQKVAVALAAIKRLCIVTGGPGTGKTTTVVKMIALMLSLSPRPLNIALTAPTGKAADRLQGAVCACSEHLAVDDRVKAAIPDKALTLHRLLGIRKVIGVEQGEQGVLPYDVVVVDECSMVDLPMLAQLVSRLAPHASLVLLGDQDQLCSIEAGSVLGDLCRRHTGLSEAAGQAVRSLCGETVPTAGPRSWSLQDCIVALRRTYRFDEHSAIGRLAAAVRRGDGDEAAAVLRRGGESGLDWFETQGAVLEPRFAERVVALFEPFRRAVMEAEDIATVFEQFQRFRLLCATRSGHYGVGSLNALVEAQWHTHGKGRQGPWYPGRPVMILRNDYGTQLYNGDVGLTLPDVRGRMRVYFATGAGSFRSLTPAQTPLHETAFAMTVHKSQGSEFSEVFLILPPEPTRVLSRELVYTAITRARRRFGVYGSEVVFRQAVMHSVKRSSGLLEQLAEV